MLSGRPARRFGTLVVFLSAIGHGHGGAISKWNSTLVDITSSREVMIPSHLEMRLYAMTHQAMAEAVIDVGQSSPRKDDTAIRAALAEAAREMLASLLPPRVDPNQFAERQLSALTDITQKTRGIEWGRQAARRVQRARSDDRWAELGVDGVGLGLVPDASDELARAVSAGTEPPRSRWLLAKPFALKTAEQFSPAEPNMIAMDGTVRTNPHLSDPKLFSVVNRTLPPESLQETWRDRPARIWNRIAQALADSAGLSVIEEARLFTALNVALADAGLSAVHWRYVLGTWRATLVETWVDARGAPLRNSDTTAPAVFDGIESGVARLEMFRLLIPPLAHYPAYTPVLAGAAESALTECLKGDRRGFNLEVENATPLVRSYGSIREAARECTFVASIDGRHSRESAIAGYQLGLRIGREAARRSLRELR